MMKGQSTIEFLIATLLFLLSILTVLILIPEKTSEFQDSIDERGKNIEIQRFTEKIVSEPGYHNAGTGGNNWEKYENSIVSFGLASDYLILEKDKIDSISTTGSSKFNYSQFKNISEVKNQYNLKFIWLPIIETSKRFKRTQAPPKITEPTSSYYNTAENTVHYGSLKLKGSNYNFLVTAHDGVYNTTRVREGDWDFDGEEYHGEGDYLILNGLNFTIKNFQNRENERGASIILKNEIKTFGPQPREVDQSIIKFNRYAALNVENTDLEPLRLEVLAW